jgi:hypothetical protein
MAIRRAHARASAADRNRCTVDPHRSDGAPRQVTHALASREGTGGRSERSSIGMHASAATTLAPIATIHTAA